MLRLIHHLIVNHHLLALVRHRHLSHRLPLRQHVLLIHLLSLVLVVDIAKRYVLILLHELVVLHRIISIHLPVPASVRWRLLPLVLVQKYMTLIFVGIHLTLRLLLHVTLRIRLHHLLGALLRLLLPTILIHALQYLV